MRWMTCLGLSISPYVLGHAPALQRAQEEHQRGNVIVTWARGRGLHSSTSQLNLSRVFHKKPPYTP
jgi:hypothetical protein